MNESAEIQKKIEFYDFLMGDPDAVDLYDIGSHIGHNIISTDTALEIMRGWGILDKHNHPYQIFIDAGWFRTLDIRWNDEEGDRHVLYKCVVLPKGIIGVCNLIDVDTLLEEMLLPENFK
nr:MAG TPA: antirepressor protein [Caudoviricetes sp.]